MFKIALVALVALTGCAANKLGSLQNNLDNIQKQAALAGVASARAANAGQAIAAEVRQQGAEIDAKIVRLERAVASTGAVVRGAAMKKARPVVRKVAKAADRTDEVLDKVDVVLESQRQQAGGVAAQIQGHLAHIRDIKEEAAATKRSLADAISLIEAVKKGQSSQLETVGIPSISGIVMAFLAWFVRGKVKESH